MKNYIKNFLLSSLFFGVFVSIIPTLIGGVAYGVVIGVICGTIFGVLMLIFTLFQAKKYRTKEEEICKGKKIVISGGANYFVGREAVGGWLILTDEELLFESHKLNIQCKKVTILLENILEIKPKLTLKLIPNGVIVTTKDHKVYQFVVNDRKLWIRKVNEQLLDTN